ncbi:MAG: hypothetical protein Q7S27_02185 [Nanoarchaeota archaeon]|nr:hypothetical protein [Nanoarchaeota archaeon]
MLSVKFCPQCNSEDIQMVAGGITGTWTCKDCGYIGSIFPEKEIAGSEQKKETGKRIGERKK